LDLPEPVAADQFLGFRERAVDYDALLAGKADALALRARVQAIPAEQHAGFDQFLIELAHFGEELLTGHGARLVFLAGFYQYHDAHRSISFWSSLRAGWRTVSSASISRSTMASSEGQRDRHQSNGN